MVLFAWFLGCLTLCENNSSLERAAVTRAMTAAENVCYTLINVPMDSEPPSEISLKNDLGKYWQ